MESLIWKGKYLSPLLFLFLFVFNGPLKGQITFPADTDLCQHDDWKLVFHDEFNGTGLDETKWIPYGGAWDGVNHRFFTSPPVPVTHADTQAIKYMTWYDDGKSFYDPKNIRISDGNCYITFHYDPQTMFGARRPSTTAKLFHPNDFHSGRFDIRCKIPRVGGIWAAYWLFGSNECNPVHPGGSEIDCFEYMPCEGNPDVCTCNVHGFKRRGCLSPDTGRAGSFTIYNIDSWHVYATEWDENFIRTYVDSILVNTKARYLAGDVLSDCNPGRSSRNGSWLEDKDTFPFYDMLHHLNLNLELKATDDIYTMSDGHSGCMPRSKAASRRLTRSRIEAALPDRVWVIDYIRVYQRASHIEPPYTALTEPED